MAAFSTLIQRSCPASVTNSFPVDVLFTIAQHFIGDVQVTTCVKEVENILIRIYKNENQLYVILFVLLK